MKAKQVKAGMRVSFDYQKTGSFSYTVKSVDGDMAVLVHKDLRTAKETVMDPVNCKSFHTVPCFKTHVNK